MDKDRIAGSAKDFAGKVEGAVGDIAGDTKTQAAGRTREAAGTVQNLYGQAKDAARDAGEAAVSYAKDAYENSGDTLRDGSQAVAKQVQDNPLGSLLGRRRHRFCAGADDDALAAPAAAALALLRLANPEARPPWSRLEDQSLNSCSRRATRAHEALDYRVKNPGTEAERPTLAGGRGMPLMADALR